MSLWRWNDAGLQKVLTSCSRWPFSAILNALTQTYEFTRHPVEHFSSVLHSSLQAPHCWGSLRPLFATNNRWTVASLEYKTSEKARQQGVGWKACVVNLQKLLLVKKGEWERTVKKKKKSNIGICRWCARKIFEICRGEFTGAKTHPIRSCAPGARGQTRPTVYIGDASKQKDANKTTLRVEFRCLVP